MSIDLYKSAELVRRPDAEVATPDPAPARQTVVGRIVRHPQTVVATLRESERTKKVVRVVGPPVRVTGRVLWTTGQGWKSWAKRAYSGATHGARRELVRNACAMRDFERIDEQLDKLRDDKRVRSTLLKELPGNLFGLVQVMAGGLLMTLALLVVLGLAIQLTPGGWDWSDWWSAIGALVEAIGNVLFVLWVSALWAAAPLLLALGYSEGRKAGTPRWMATKNERAEMDSVIDERMVSLALAHLGIGALNAFFKNGGHLEYLVMPRKDGDGTFTRINLPLGCTAEMVADQRGKLAGNLRRAGLETWPVKGEEDGILDLWIADKGKLSQGAGAWPLQFDGVVDAFEGVPIGLSQRGDVVTAPLFETNWLFGGRPGQGKTSGMRCVALGAALDPTAEEWAFIFGESSDFAPLEPRLTRYAMGFDPGVFEQAIQALRDLTAEMERRGKVLSAQPGSPPKTSRKLANKRELGLHLLFCFMDEVHELFQDPTYGKEAAELAIRLIKRGRKYGIILVLATQSPTKDSIPREVTRNVGCGVAYSVQDHVANDGLLGTGKHRAGITATALRYNVDRGTAVTVGITDNTFELIRFYYVKYEDGADEVTPIITRAMGNITQLRRTGSEPLPQMIDAPPDHLRDIREAMHDEARVRTPVLLGRLMELDAETYEPWGFQELKAALEADGVAVGKSDGQSVVRLKDVQEAISDRAQEL